MEPRLLKIHRLYSIEVLPETGHVKHLRISGNLTVFSAKYSLWDGYGRSKILRESNEAYGIELEAEESRFRIKIKS
jgi:hypothetical protein